jgi:hypothetical protein
MGNSEVIHMPLPVKWVPVPSDEQEVLDWRQSEGCRHVARDVSSGMKDELGTEKLFKNMLGRDYTVRGFDGY